MRDIAAQLIVFGTAVEEDLEGCLAAVAEAGYGGAETGLLADQVRAGSLRRMLKRNGLGLAGIHVGFAQLEQVGAAIDYALEAGTKYLICSGVGDRANGLDAYAAAADEFDRAGALARDRGAVFCYHNHSWEFEEFNGKTGLDVLYQSTDPDLVKLCVDVFWVADAGQDPTVFLHRHRKRLALVHLKDGKPGQRLSDGRPEFQELGSGKVDLPATLRILDLADLEWVTVEQDRSSLPAGVSVRRSREYLRTIGY